MMRPGVVCSMVVGVCGFAASASAEVRPGFEFGWSETLREGFLIDAQVADMDGDGRADLVILTEFPSPHPTVLMTAARGGFESNAAEPVRGGSPAQVRMADFDGDGALDTMETEYFGGPGDVTVRLGNGDGTLAEALSYGTPGLYGYWRDLELGDFDGDSDVDAAAIGFKGAGVPTFINDGSGAFSNGPAAILASVGSQLTSGDTNGDGVLDLAVMLPDGGHLLEGNGDGTFQFDVESFTMGTNVKDLVLVDLNGGLIDIAAAADGAVVLRRNFSGHFQFMGILPQFTIPVEGQASSLDVGDVDLDGLIDIVAETEGGTALLLNLGNMNFSDPLALPGPGMPLLGDADADGDLDLFLVTEAAASVYLNDTIVPPAGPDLDGSGFVDSADLNLVLGSFGCVGGACVGDTDADGDVDSVDLNAVLAAFGTAAAGAADAA